MNEQQEAAARRCHAGADDGTMTFPQIVAALNEAGFESYLVDFRRSQTTFYLVSGESLVLASVPQEAPIAEALDTDALTAAIREAQTLAPGYSYKGFCAKARAAGCAGYIVSFSGRRALYFGRTAETHAEIFPQ